MTRRTIALGILGLWVVGLALLYRRSTFRSPEQSLAEAGMKVSPATYYYRLEQNNQQIGAASSALDTTTALLVATDYVRAVVPVANDTLQMQARSVARFSRALSMKDFILKAEGDLSPFLLRGVIQGDGTARRLQLTTETPKKHATTEEYDVAGLLFFPTVAPIPLMLGTPRKPGASMPIGMFDPLTRSVRNVNLRIQKDSLFTLTDSASLDSATGRWVKAHEDTVRGWLISGDVPTITAWVDSEGRMLAGSEPGGISLIRTTFEIAFDNWRLDRASTREGASAKLDSASVPRARRK
ncbi:MAG TPA: hypothetical protein VES88_15785 [Gemmatimonadaceae bacterium]|nr:hypothetical protein [Gemmatimonadaceae bacterium]